MTTSTIKTATVNIAGTGFAIVYFFSLFAIVPLFLSLWVSSDLTSACKKDQTAALLRGRLVCIGQSIP